MKHSGAAQLPIPSPMPTVIEVPAHTKVREAMNNQHSELKTLAFERAVDLGLS